MSALLKFEVQAVWIECSNCHLSFAITSSHRERLISDRSTFYCPSGHSQWYPGKTDAQKVRDEMQEELDAANSALEWARGQAAKDAKSARKAKSDLKKISNRVNAGVCPHCNRTFQQLSRHMQCKHAEVTK